MNLSQLYNGIVVRPPMIYGREKGHFTKFFQQVCFRVISYSFGICANPLYQAIEGKISIFGSDTVLPVGHIDDVAEAYAKVIEADPKVVHKQIFHFAEDAKYVFTYAAAILANQLQLEPP